MADGPMCPICRHLAEVHHEGGCRFGIGSLRGRLCACKATRDEVVAALRPRRTP